MPIIKQKGLTFAFAGPGALTEGDLPGFRIDVLHTNELKSPAERVRSGGRASIHTANTTEFDSADTHAASPRSSAANA